ncbi:MAG: relaxase/mobilization nuclease domain-containing protein [Alphaproteobacteria bacterium]|nr:relaxase/mobilization nuclease domain-containing protein [Alphaproteobacteria bacterium]
MWIQGRRRGGAKDLAYHLQKTEENESVSVKELGGFAFDGLTSGNLTKALRQMEAIGYGKGQKRNLYHAILAPAYGETLNAAQQKFMVAYYAEHMGLVGHDCALVEHWKKGKQHFHLVFNIINPTTGKTHELKWSKTKEWKISRGLEEIFGLSTTDIKGKAARTWEMQRGKRTGIDPRKMRKDVTAIFHANATTQEFIAALDKAGFVLTKGQRGQLVLVDRFGDTHGLMRQIEGKKLADLRQKLVGIERENYPDHAELVKACKPLKANAPREKKEPTDLQQVREGVQRAYRASKSGAAFFASLNKKGYALGRGLKGFAIIDGNGERHNLDRLLGKDVAKGLNKKFPDLAALRPRPVSELMRCMNSKKHGGKRRSCGGGAGFNLASAHTPETNKPLRPVSIKAVHISPKRQEPTPTRPAPTKKGWPEAAILDWKVWGHKFPARFFTLWPELAPIGFVPFTPPQR